MTMAAMNNLAEHKCPGCHMTLFRIKEPDGRDRIFCEVCNAIGDYDRVVSGEEVLIAGTIMGDDLAEVRRNLGLTTE